MGRETTDSVQTLLARPDIAPLFYARISGVPYLWGNLAIPADWDEGGGTLTIDGDTYTWETSLVVGTDFASVTQRAEPKRGLGVAGSLALTFSVAGSDAPENDTWLSLLVRNLARSDEAATDLTADLDADVSGGAEVITVSNASDFAASAQDVHIGIECIRAGSGSNTSTTIHNIASRGAYGSWAAPHRVTLDGLGEVAAAGPYVTTWPIAWEGRVVTVWMALGRWIDGVWEPYDNGSGGRVEQEIYKGVIQGIGEGGDLLTVTVDAASLDQLLALQVCTRAPVTEVIKARKEYSSGLVPMIHIGPHNWFLSYAFDRQGDLAGPEKVLVVDKRLVVSNGGADVTEGMYTLSEVSSYIAATIQEGGYPNGSLVVRCGIFTQQDLGSGKDLRYLLQITASATNLADYALTLFVKGSQYTSIIRDLGWTSDAKMEQQQTGTDGFWTATADEAPPWFRWPNANEPAPTRLYFDEQAQSFEGTAAPGWVDDDGNAIPGAVKIGKSEIVEISGFNTDTTSTGQQFRYMTISQRGAMGTGAAKELVLKYDPDSDKNIEIKQGIYLKNTNLGRAFRYLWSSGSGVAGTLDSTYDKGWEGSGLALPPSLIDGAGISEVSADLGSVRDQIWIDEPTELRAWLEPELTIEQILCVPTADFETGDGYKLRWIKTQPPPEASVGTSRTLNHSIITSHRGLGIGLDRQENKIINNVKIRAAYNHATQKYGAEINQKHLTSQNVWGARQTITIEAKNIGGTTSAADLTSETAQRLFDRYALPYEVLEVDCANAQTWGWQIGDEVSITHEALPRLDAPGRGWSNVKGRLYVKQDHFASGGGVSSRLTIVVSNHLGFRYSYWAPSAILEDDADPPNRTTWNVTDHYFSRSTSALKDVEWFAAGYQVIVWNAGTTDQDTIEVDSIDADAGTITFASDLDASLGDGPLIMMFAHYNNGSIAANQKKFAYMNAYTQTLLNSVDQPYRYV